MIFTVLQVRQGLSKYVTSISLENLLKFRQKLNYDLLPPELLPQRPTGKKHVDEIVSYLLRDEAWVLTPIIVNLKGATVRAHPKVRGAFQIEIPDDRRRLVYPTDGAHRLAALGHIAEKYPELWKTKFAESQASLEIYINLSDDQQKKIFISISSAKPVARELIIARADRPEYELIREIAANIFSALIELERRSPLLSHARAYSLCQLFDAFRSGTAGFTRHGVLTENLHQAWKDIAEIVRSHGDFEIVQSDPTIKQVSLLFDPGVLAAVICALWRLRHQVREPQLKSAMQEVNFRRSFGAFQNPLFTDLLNDNGKFKRDAGSKLELARRLVDLLSGEALRA